MNQTPQNQTYGSAREPSLLAALLIGIPSVILGALGVLAIVTSPVVGGVAAGLFVPVDAWFIQVAVGLAVFLAFRWWSWMRAPWVWGRN